MKHIKLFSILLLIGAIAVSCKKEAKEALTPAKRIVGVWNLAKVSVKYEGIDEEEVLHDSDCTRKSRLEFGSGRVVDGGWTYGSHWIYYEKDGSECKEIFNRPSRYTALLNEGELVIAPVLLPLEDTDVFLAKVEFGFEGVLEIMLLKQKVNPEETRIFKFARTY